MHDNEIVLAGNIILDNVASLTYTITGLTTITLQGATLMTATVNASEWTKAYNQGWKDGYNSHVSKYRNPYVLTDLRQAYHDGYF